MPDRFEFPGCARALLTKQDTHFADAFQVSWVEFRRNQHAARYLPQIAASRCVSYGIYGMLAC